MGIPHKHAAIIKAWADGAEIECSSNKGKTWNFVRDPCWHPDVDYRVQPKPPIKKYLWAYCKRLDGVAKITQFYYENAESFVKNEFLNQLGTPSFHWIQRIDASEKEFPDT